jgi:hypothetical protein
MMFGVAFYGRLEMVSAEDGAALGGFVLRLVSPFDIEIYIKPGKQHCTTCVTEI